MSIEKNINITRTLMYFMNFFNILMISIIMYRSNELICWEGQARKFLENVSNVPIPPANIIFLNISLVVIFFISIYIREKYFKKKKLVIEFLFFFDMIICIISIVSLNLSYKGIILIAVVNLLTYMESSIKRYFYLSISLITYILLDYDTLSVKMNIVSLNEYIDFFTTTSKLYIYSMRSVFNSLNQVLFIGFMSFSLQKHIKEKKEIKTLYSVLIKTTEELALANIQLESYAKKSEAMAQIKERNRLAREIHDTLGHSLTGIVTGLEACKAIIDLDLKTAKSQIDKISDLGRKGLLEIRRSVKALRPDALERFLIDKALKEMVADICGCTDINIDFNINVENLEKMCADEEEIVYRIVQESITNSVRHGKAKYININIYNADAENAKNAENNIIIEIKDNGIGSLKSTEGFGLKHIRERTDILGGEFTYGNNKNYSSETANEFIKKFENVKGKDIFNQGFFIRVKIPLRLK